MHNMLWGEKIALLNEKYESGDKVEAVVSSIVKFHKCCQAGVRI